MTSGDRGDGVTGDQTAVYAVIKRHKRLWIDRGEEAVYTPPNFVKLQSREPLRALADRFTELSARCIGAIADFEAQHSSRKIRRQFT